MVDNSMYTCEFCRGSGKCTRCNGKGIVTVGFFSKNEKDCEICKGLGFCNECHGKGQIEYFSTTIARVRCPKCGTVNMIRSDIRPLEIHCDCGLNLIIKK
jgi:phage FluMu protein Com